MRKTAIVLGVVGGALGFLGGIFQTGIGALGSAFEAEGADTVASMGAWAMWLSIVALLVSCFINKKPKVLSWIILILGIICVVLGNYLSGIIIILGGIFGLFSVKNITGPITVK